jgi:hypothetical protein
MLVGEGSGDADPVAMGNAAGTVGWFLTIGACAVATGNGDCAAAPPKR